MLHVNSSISLGRRNVNSLAKLFVKKTYIRNSFIFCRILHKTILNTRLFRQLHVVIYSYLLIIQKAGKDGQMKIISHHPQAEIDRLKINVVNLLLFLQQNVVSYQGIKMSFEN